MEFRKAEPSDVARLTELRKKLLIEEGFEQTCDITDQLTEYFSQGLSEGSYVSWLAEEDEEVVAASGVCLYRLVPSFKNPSGKVAYVTSMYTAPEFRRQGIASQLLELTIEEARQMGFTTIRLHAAHGGKSIYSQYGFVDSDGYMTLR